MPEKMNLYKDGDDIIIVVKNCSTSFLDIIKKLIGTEEDPVEIPVLEPVEDDKPPVIPEEKPEKVEEIKTVGENLENIQEETKPVAEETQPVKEPDPVSKETGLKCPNCGKILHLEENGINCECNFAVKRVNGNKRLSDEDLTDMIEKGETKVYNDFISKQGKPYSAKIALNSKRVGGIRFVFM